MDVITSTAFRNESKALATQQHISSIEDEIPFRRFYNFFALFWQVVPLFILLAGIIGNVLTIVICRRPEMMSSMSVYFVTLAGSDLLSLIVNALNQWIYYTFDIDLMSLNTFACKVIGWLVYVSGVLSSWILVAMTVQRAVCVLWPHRADILCSARNSKAIALSITLFIAVLHCHVLYGLDVVVYNDSTHTTNNTTTTFSDDTNTTHIAVVTFSGSTVTAKACIVKREYMFHFSFWSWVDLLIFSLLPWLCLVVSNSVLLWTLNVSIRQAQHSLGSAHTDGFSGRKKQASSLTVTLFVVSMAFIVLNLPISCLQLVGFFHHMAGSLDYLYPSKVIAYCNEIAIAVWETNSAVNFYLYCLTGSRFRKELKKMFGCASQERNTHATILSTTG